MRNSILSISLLLALLSCTKTMAQGDFTIISAEFRTPIAERLILRNNYYDPIDTLLVNSAGMLVDTVEIETGFYYLSLPGTDLTLYLLAGGETVMKFPTEDYKQRVEFLGSGAAENNYLANKLRLRGTFPPEQIAYSGYVQLGEKDFLRLTDSIQAVYLGLFEKAEGLSPEFTDLERSSITIQRATRLESFGALKRRFGGAPDFKVSADYPDPYQGINLNDPDLMGTYGYMTLVHTFVNRAANKVVEADPEVDFFIQYQQELKNSQLHPLIRDQLGLYVAEYGFTYAKDLNAFAEAFFSYATTPSILKAFAEAYQAKKMEAGQASPSFDFSGVDGQRYTLEDFKGKYVYIDLWASWCGPCLAQIPSLKSLEAEFSEKVNFVSISFKDNKASWEAMIKEKKLTGYQLYAPKGDNDFFSFYGVTGIPRFILLDRQGRIIESVAKQPSEPSLREQLADLE